MDNSFQAFSKLLAYCEANDWAGYDPFDALNSRVFQTLPLLDKKIPRLILTQALKRSPINIRPLALVPKSQNPKAMGLFLTAFLRLSEKEVPNREQLIGKMIERIVALRSPAQKYWCWGYNFPWQMRTELVPMGAPNLVTTYFVASALLAAYEQRRDRMCLEIAVSAADYIHDELFRSEGEVAMFRYPLPTDYVPIHNANFLAAELLCRVAKLTGENRYLGRALAVTRYSVNCQAADGSWEYGSSKVQSWIDNFHTGYNLCALKDLGKHLQTSEFEESVRKGYKFYRDRFFREDGAAKYFHDRVYPIDIHSVAQSIITLHAFREEDPGAPAQARKVLDWAMRNMWNPKGYFAYRVLRSCTIRTPYMRWSEAWMLLALAEVIRTETPQESRPEFSGAKRAVSAWA